MPSGRAIFLAVLTAVALRVGVELGMTIWRVRSDLSTGFRAHDALFGICDTVASGLSNDLGPYCRMAEDARNMGYWYFFARDVLHKTKWCLGHECSIDVPVTYWYLALAGIILNPRVLWGIRRWIVERPERKRDRFMRNAVKDGD